MQQMLEQNLVLLPAKHQDKASTAVGGGTDQAYATSDDVSSFSVLCTLPFMCMCPSIYLDLKRPLDIHGFGLKTPVQPICNRISNCIVQLVPSY